MITNLEQYREKTIGPRGFAVFVSLRVRLTGIAGAAAEAVLFAGCRESPAERADGINTRQSDSVCCSGRRSAPWGKK